MTKNKRRHPLFMRVFPRIATGINENRIVPMAGRAVTAMPACAVGCGSRTLLVYRSK